jgi:hypothetical protein
MTKLVTTLKLLTAAAAAIALQAHAAPTALDEFFAKSPRLDAQFGDAVNAAKAQQTINPDASRNRNAVAGLDGKAAEEAMLRYRESFKTPPPAANVFTIGVSGNSTQ